MSQTITAHFDGKVIIPEQPVKLPVGKRLRIQVALDQSENGKKTSKRRKIIGTGQFCSGISDLATNKKYLEGFGKRVTFPLVHSKHPGGLHMTGRRIAEILG